MAIDLLCGVKDVKPSYIKLYKLYFVLVKVFDNKLVLSVHSWF